MNARDIIKLAAQLYVYDELKKKITILTNIQKGKDINVDIFLPKVTDVTVSDFAKHLQKAIESQPEEERAKHRKFFGEPISFARRIARGHKMAGIEKYYEITEVYAWQWEGNTNITIEDIPEEIRNEVTMLKVERSIKTSFTEESNQLFFNYKGYQYNLFPGDFLIFEYNEFIDGFQFICVEREKDSLKKYRKCNSILFLPTSKTLDSLNPKDAIEASAINFFNESCQALGILVDLNKKRLATCKKCGKTNKECFPTTIEEYDMYIEMLCENCLTEILDKKITAIEPKKIE